MVIETFECHWCAGTGVDENDEENICRHCMGDGLLDTDGFERSVKVHTIASYTAILAITATLEALTTKVNEIWDVLPDGWKP